MKPNLNPFVHGRPVDPSEFLGREREMRTLVSRIATGQNTAIIGGPHAGKTSLLSYLLDAAARNHVCGDRLEHCFFSSLSGEMLYGIKTQPAFWAQALQPIKGGVTGQLPDKVAEFYTSAEKNEFGLFVLDKFFEGLHSTGSRLVLVLDEFDALLAHPVLNSAEFYGGLRALASRSQGLVVVLAARRDVAHLNQLTQLSQSTSSSGSPYLNIFTEIHLGSLAKEELAQLLARAGKRFDEKDCEYVIAVSGGHPFLAQAAAAMLWEMDEEGAKEVERYSATGQAFYRQVKSHLTETWDLWSNETRKAIMAVALTQIPGLIPDHSFAVSELGHDLHDYESELQNLCADGVLTGDNSGNWQVTGQVFLWWLADQLRRNVRDNTEFTKWLQAQEMDGLFTTKEKQKLEQATQWMLDAVGRGASTLIDSLAKGIMEGATRGVKS